ncbi:D-Ala-D-Ala carboxypeptidase family metallohydrolase [Myxococcota bacterium]|nr:D-Ala-D-Ala carboxypeptidase family metallohydrolase [Myxococcota bacterium]
MARARPGVLLIGGGALLGLGAVALAIAAAPSTPASSDRLLSTLRGDRMSVPEGMPERPGVWFTWREFTRTGSGLPNELPTWAYPRILKLVRFVLDPVRARIGRPMGVGSGYRSPAVNKAIGGADKSQHMAGEAADVKAGDMPAERLATEFVRAAVPFDQLIWYDPELGGHVHVSHNFEGAQRGQMLHAYVANRGPDGKATKPYVKKFRAWAPPPEGVQS